MEQIKEDLPRGLYTFHKVVVKEAHGCHIIDDQGREYIDLTSGLGVLQLGYMDSRIIATIEEQSRSLVHMCSHVMLHRPYLELVRCLNALVPMVGPCKTFLCNSGAEAMENAVKIARYATGRRTLLAFNGGYHGRTLLCMTLSSRAKPYRKGFGPLAPEIYHVPFAYCYRCPWELKHPACCLRCLEALNEFFLLATPPEEVAAVVLEPIQGEGGVVVPPDDFMQRLQEICHEHGILIIADEVQTGMARTGRTFAVQHAELQPDILVLGKALGGGLPLASVTGRSSVMDAPHGGGLGSTFGGNPVACASALRTLEILQQEDLPERARQIEARIQSRAQRWEMICPWIGEVRGRGAMFGIELVEDKLTKDPAAQKARQVVRRCFDRGAVLISGGLHRNVVRLLPPLSIPWEDLEAGLQILEESLSDLEQNAQ
jgi:4-aminobutyrate aminotransferase/(S)-3-amino-2-methylpropionate transaminase